MQNTCPNRHFFSFLQKKRKTGARIAASLLILVFFGLFGKGHSELWAWNPNYAYGLPTQREFCAKRDSKETWKFRPLGLEELCQKDEIHYLAVFAKEPRGAVALIKLKKFKDFYPKPGIKWPAEALAPDKGLWHFTCLGERKVEVLDTQVSLRVFLGDFTAPTKRSCEESRAAAHKHCQKKLKGQEILESCAGYW